MQQAPAAALTETIGDDIMRLKYGGWFELKIIDKPILQIPMHYIPESNPMVAASTTENISTVWASGQNGGGGPIAMYKFGIPITLNPFESFACTLNFDGVVALNQTFDIQLALHAFMRRPT